jgi:DNA-binding IclR family transcriptional regulator
LDRKQNSEFSVQTIQRAAAILRCFSEGNPELGVTAIGHMTGIHKSTVSRLLLALNREGFVSQNAETGKWRLGLGLLNLAGMVLENLDLRELAKNHLAELARVTQETINISVLDGDECVNIECLLSPKPIKYAGRLGRRVPLHCTSTGKVLLAFLSREQLDGVLPEELPPFTKGTITDRTALEVSLDRVRAQDYAIVHEEFEEGLSAIAAPIRDHTGRVIATVSVSGPTYRMGPGKIERFTGPLLETAGKISADLGNIPYKKEGIKQSI